MRTWKVEGEEGRVFAERLRLSNRRHFQSKGIKRGCMLYVLSIRKRGWGVPKRKARARSMRTKTLLELNRLAASVRSGKGGLGRIYYVLRAY